jgi:ring-1,2-phenylacetyl-CoA epoxidase subunit PaaE
MALHFHPLKIKDIKRETPECVSIAFDIPEDLREEFKFTHGQNINVRTYFNGEEVRRTYSICTAPFENELRVAVKKMSNGAFSTFANSELKEGDTLDVMPPSGKFNTVLNPAHKKNYVAFAAGSGITPIVSIIKTTLKAEPHSTFTLVFGNKNTNSIIFKEELQSLKDKYMERFQLHNVLSRERMEADINYGRIDEKKCAQLEKLIDYKAADDFFICGPENLIFTVKDFLENYGIDKKKIHFELFTTPDKKPQNTNYKPQAASSTTASSITVKLDGRSFDFNLDYDSNSILDAALAAGADLPFACKGGVCCTCKAKLVEGKVDMEVNYGLEHDEIEAGFILTCQSHPRTDKVVVDFDIK